jgi:multidrug resistance efflux pump
LPEGELQDRVQQLNQAIEDVRRQLESLSIPAPVDR